MTHVRKREPDHAPPLDHDDDRWAAVVRRDGALSGCPWGVERQRALLDREAMA